MTEKLYYADSYMSSFSATVISCENNEGIYKIVLDRTAFFPNEGGQYADSGTLNGIPVIDCKEEGCVIYHVTESPIEVGEEVFGVLDFDERYEKMQCHTAEHILSGIIHTLFSLDNVGFHLGKDEVTMDISAPLTREELDRVEKLANEAVYKNTKVKAYFPSSEEAQKIEYRSKLDITENLRIVEIDGVDSCACCAPHVSRTGEIGLIKILDFAKLRGGIRIHITAGRRAMRLFSEYYGSAAEISAILSLPKSDIKDGVVKLLSDLKSAESKYELLRLDVMREKAESITKTEGNLVLLFEDATNGELIEFSNIAKEKVSGILVLLSGGEKDYRYIISSDSVNLREKSSEINSRLNGRGGGKPNMLQGRFSASYSEIFEYFNP